MPPTGLDHHRTCMALHNTDLLSTPRAMVHRTITRKVRSNGVHSETHRLVLYLPMLLNSIHNTHQPRTQIMAILIMDHLQTNTLVWLLLSILRVLRSTIKLAKHLMDLVLRWEVNMARWLRTVLPNTDLLSMGNPRMDRLRTSLTMLANIQISLNIRMAR